MDSYDVEDNRLLESEQSVQVSHGDQKDLALSGYRNKKLREDNESSRGNRARTRTQERSRDPDKDQMSDGEQSSASFYSDDYENASLSDRSFSPRFPSPSSHRGARTQRKSSSPVHQTGVRKGVPRRPGPQTVPSHQRSSGLRSQSLGKDAPPKDLDLVTKRLLSARLLKISELKNALGELQLRTDELQRENRLLKQLQLRHEKALHRYSDTESEISQLLSRHNNETHVLRERLRRTQEKERMAERRCVEADAQLQRCRDQLHKLQQLADDQRLGEREELARKLVHAQVKVQESERRVKELEKNMELSTGSFQRQLASERKKTHDALQETQTLREEINKLSTKLKERERELDTRNIYANRMLKGASKKDLEESTRRKDFSRSCSKAVQTEDTMVSLDFPSPPLAITNCSEFSCNDPAADYLSLKDQQSSEQGQMGAEAQRIQETTRGQVEDGARGMEMEEQGREKNRLRERERKGENEKEMVQKQRINFEFNLSEEKGMRQSDGWDRDEKERKRRNEWQTEIERGKEPHLSEQENQANHERAEEERRRKNQLLAKMREIDMQAKAQDSSFFHEEKESTRTPPRNENTSIFSFTDPHDYLSTSKTGNRGVAMRSQKTNQDLDLTFGSYAPSFGKPAPRAGLGRRSPSLSVEQLSGDENGGVDLSGLAKEKKSDFLQQLFGSSVFSAPYESPSKMELLSSPNTKSSSGHRRDAETPGRMKRTTLHVSESGPAVRAITTLDDDIEEVML
ncbi:lebercilin [Tachysurus ichikawai]